MGEVSIWHLVGTPIAFPRMEFPPQALPKGSYHLSHPISTFFFNINLFIYYLFLSELGLRCVQAFSSCSERGLLLVAVRGLLIAVASLVVEHRL